MEEWVSKEKVNEELLDEAEVTAEFESGSKPPEEAIEGDIVGEDFAADLAKELAAAQQEVADLRDRMLRAAAENDNFKKRIERERQLSLKYAGETIFKEMLPVVDNLERAVHQGVIKGAPAEQNLAALLEGVQLTLKSLLTTLEKFEVKAIDSIGKPFDPQHQEALTMAESDSVPASHVVTEFEKGYNYKDKLLRAAKVIVSAGKKTTD